MTYLLSIAIRYRFPWVYMYGVNTKSTSDYFRGYRRKKEKVALTKTQKFVILSALWMVDPAKVVVSGTQTTTIIEELTPATSYHVRVIAENAIGTSEPSDEAQAITQEESKLRSKNCFYLWIFIVFITRIYFSDNTVCV